MNDQSYPYQILPFQFKRFPHSQVLLVNSVGEFIFIGSKTFQDLINYNIQTQSRIFLDLKGKHFLTDSELSPVVDLLATKYRTKKAFLTNFTALHMIVVTLRCNHACRYCHASSEPHENTAWDMDWETARRVVEMIFMSPSPEIKIEFQGGEPLLNWDIVKGIVEYAKALNGKAKKRLEIVVCTNLTLITQDMLEYMKLHDMLVSTSLDGPKDIHDKNRLLRKGDSSYDLFTKKLKLTQDFLGHDRVSALMTTSQQSLNRMRDVVDEYLSQGFNNIFLRALNPYGFAKSDHKILGYQIEDFVASYKEVLTHIINLNLEGTYFEEAYATLLLTRILTPFATGFMDLQNPAGVGITGVIYDYTGEVYPSDEARMLAKMGDKIFLMGNVKADNYFNIFGGHTLRKIINKSILEILPGCSSCAFQMFCGADPVRNYSEQGDIVGNRPTNDFCKKHMEIFRFLFELIRENDENVMDVFWSWITRRPLEEVKGAQFSGTGF